MSVLLATWTSATAALADSSDATYVDDTESNGGTVTISGRPLDVSAALSGVAGSAAIDHLIFRARARKIEVGGGVVYDAALVWTLSGAQGAVAYALTDSITAYSSGETPLDPSGAAWTWAKVAALTGVGMAGFAYLPPAASGTLRVAEVSVEIYGGGGGIEADLMAGDATGDLIAESGTRDMIAGDATGDLVAAP